MLFGFTLPAAAQDFPSKPIRFVIPYPSGASPDVMAVIGKKVDESLGQRMLPARSGR